MNLGFIIAFIYFIIILFWVLNFFFYFLWLTKPAGIFWDVFPRIYVTIISTINQILLRIFGYIFFILTIVLLLLYFIWLILKSLPWPMDFLSEIPPLGGLREAGIFTLFDRIFEIFLELKGPQSIFKDISFAITGFLKKFLIKVYEETNPTVAEKLKQLPSDEPPEPEGPPKRPEPENKHDPEKYLKDTMGSVIDKNIQHCIRQNTQNITPDMNTFETLQTNLLNRFNNILCQLKAIEPNVKVNITNNIL